MRKAEKSGFPGGIHPTDGYDKLLTMALPVRVYEPDTVTILAEQSFGGTCELQVHPGDKVKEGDLIGTPAAFMAAPLHASVSGEVLDVREVLHQEGTSKPALSEEKKRGRKFPEATPRGL